MNHKQLLDDVANEAAESTFTDWYKNDKNLGLRRREGLGIKIAAWSDWDAVPIMQIFRAALEDANFHGKAAIVDSWLGINGWNKED